MFGVDETKPPPRRRSAALGGGAVGAAVGFFVGAAVVAAAFAVLPREPVPRELTGEELTAACTPQVTAAREDLATVQDDLDAATGQIDTLTAAVEAKEAEITTLKAEMEVSAEKRAALAGKLKQAEAELLALEGQLAIARLEQEQLSTRLASTTSQLEAQVDATGTAREDGLDEEWHKFVYAAQLSICDAGGRKKLGRCRETVAESLDHRVRAAYEHCVRAGQESPSMGESADGAVPKYGHWLGQEDKVTKDWYVLLCDPDLPEQDWWVEVQQPDDGIAEPNPVGAADAPSPTAG